MLGLPVRLGQPVNVRGRMAAVRNPAYSTGVGLVAYGYESSPDAHASDGFLCGRRLQG